MLSQICQFEHLKADNKYLENKIKELENAISMAEATVRKSFSNEISHVWRIILEADEEETRLKKELRELKTKMEPSVSVANDKSTIEANLKIKKLESTIEELNFELQQSKRACEKALCEKEKADAERIKLVKDILKVEEKLHKEMENNQETRTRNTMLIEQLELRQKAHQVEVDSLITEHRKETEHERKMYRERFENLYPTHLPNSIFSPNLTHDCLNNNDGFKTKQNSEQDSVKAGCIREEVNSLMAKKNGD